MNNSAIILLLIPAAAGLVIPAFTLISKGFGRLLSFLAFLAGAIYGGFLLPSVMEESISVVVAGWLPPYGINLVLTPASLGFLVLAFSVAALAVFFDLVNGRERKGQYYLLLSLTVMASGGMLLTGDLFNLFVFIEVAGIASFALIAAGNPHSGAGGALRYLIPAQLTSLLMLGGIGLLYSAAGSLNLAGFVGADRLNPAFGFLAGTMVLLPVLLETKQFPFNGWVARAYDEAACSFSALLSGVVALAGGYVLLRITLTLIAPGGLFDGTYGELRLVVLVLGSATVLVGEFAAFREENLKRVLAYSSVGQMGMIAVAAGAASTLTVQGALILLISHTAAKALLFLISGFFIKSTGTFSWKKMAGLGRQLPLLGGLFVVGAMTLMGLPLFSGFWGKLWLIQGTVEVGGYALIGLTAILLGTILEGVYFMKIGHNFFTRPETASEGVDTTFLGVRPNIGVLLPALVLAVVVIAIGVFPALISDWLNASVRDFLDPEVYKSIVDPSIVDPSFVDLGGSV